MGEASELDRIAYLPLGNVEESGLGFGQEMMRMTVYGDGNAYAFTESMPRMDGEGMHFSGGDETPDMERDTPEHRNRRWFTAVIEACDSQIAALNSIYPVLRELDLSLGKIWELFNAEGTMPSAPPVYWNMKGYYLTEEEALAAIQLEQAEWALKNRMSDDDAAREAVQALMLMHAGI